MGNFVTLQPESHKDAAYSPLTSFEFASEMALVPILKDEIPNTVGLMCLAFRRSIVGDGKVFDLVGLQSLGNNRNYFVLPNGKWLHGYIPAFYRSHPFALKSGDNRNQFQLCIDSDYINYKSATNDQKFFDEKLELTEHLRKVINFLLETLRSRQETIDLCQSLDDAGLIVEWPIKFSEPDEKNKSTKKTLQGLYHVDAEALANLSGEQLVKLNQSGALRLANAQLLSEARLKDLAQLQTAYLQMESDNEKQANSGVIPDLDELFGEKDDLFSF